MLFHNNTKVCLIYFGQDYRWLDDYRNQYVFCLIGSLCYLEMTEDIQKYDEMFNEIDDGEWNISDDHNDDLRGGSEKE